MSHAHFPGNSPRRLPVKVWLWQTPLVNPPLYHHSKEKVQSPSDGGSNRNMGEKMMMIILNGLLYSALSHDYGNGKRKWDECHQTEVGESGKLNPQKALSAFWRKWFFKRLRILIDHTRKAGDNQNFSNETANQRLASWWFQLLQHGKPWESGSFPIRSSTAGFKGWRVKVRRKAECIEQNRIIEAAHPGIGTYFQGCPGSAVLWNCKLHFHSNPVFGGWCKCSHKRRNETGKTWRHFQRD